MARKVEITVDTAYGTLVARAGDDLLNEPDITIFLLDKNGREIALARVSDGTADGENGVRIGVFSNVADESPAGQFLITEKQLRLPGGCWINPDC